MASNDKQQARAISPSIRAAGGRILWLAFLTLFLFAQVKRRRTATLPAPTGAHAVGRTLYHWVDRSRQEPLSHTPGAKRELMVWVWYPAAPEPAATSAAYLPGSWGQVVMQHNPQLLFSQSLRAVRAHAIAEAPISKARRAYPVLIMEPGLGLLPTDFTTLAEDLASWGYVVVGITPTYSAPAVVFPDGRIIPASQEVVYGADTQLAQVWANDIIFVIDQLERLNHDSESPLNQRLDLERIGVFGHSFGGAAAALACQLDSRCKAGINVDGLPYGDVLTKGLSQPFMIILSDHSPSDARSERIIGAVRSLYNALRHDRYQFVFQGTRHFNFADIAVFFAPFQHLTGFLGPIDGERGLAITCAYIRAFFDRYLNDADASLLDGPCRAYPEVELRQCRGL